MEISQYPEAYSVRKLEYSVIKSSNSIFKYTIIHINIVQ